MSEAPPVSHWALDVSDSDSDDEQDRCVACQSAPVWNNGECNFFVNQCACAQGTCFRCFCQQLAVRVRTEPIAKLVDKDSISCFSCRKTACDKVDLVYERPDWWHPDARIEIVLRTCDATAHHQTWWMQSRRPKKQADATPRQVVPDEQPADSMRCRGLHAMAVSASRVLAFLVLVAATLVSLAVVPPVEVVLFAAEFVLLLLLGCIIAVVSTEQPPPFERFRGIPGLVLPLALCLLLHASALVPGLAIDARHRMDDTQAGQHQTMNEAALMLFAGVLCTVACLATSCCQGSGLGDDPDDGDAHDDVQQAPEPLPIGIRVHHRPTVGQFAGIDMVTTVLCGRKLVQRRPRARAVQEKPSPSRPPSDTSPCPPSASSAAALPLSC
jgi:hypothetical protein